MAKVRPFCGLRPSAELAPVVSSRPYDVLSSQEAFDECAGNEKSLYHIIKPEINFTPIADEHDPKVYDAAVSQFAKFQKEGWLKRDAKPCYYLYSQTMQGRTQYGLVVAANVQDYVSGVIKKHELTRADKEEDRMKHVRCLNANLEPVFFAFPDNDVLAQVIDKTASQPSVEKFTSAEGFGHEFWVIDDEELIARITEAFAAIPYLYIADGHHRTAAAARVGLEKAQNDPHHTGDEEYNFFLAVCFPASQLKIMDYNRVVRDLNGLTSEQFLAALADNFDVQLMGAEEYRPAKLHNFSLYLDDQWYSLTAKPGTYDDSDPIGVLDVSVSSNLILDRILGIKDLRRDKRIDFVGGLRGLGELKRRVDSGEMRVALALYPVSMDQLIAIADSGNIMPPKTTWFEPKLRSGLIVHSLD
ncbi:MAG: DUF1015 domain-containing protein [Bacteroidales bacterium]|nr:DUF1015 domain-containing protein [Candidatus Liminaster caballi]